MKLSFYNYISTIRTNSLAIQVLWFNRHYGLLSSKMSWKNIWSKVVARRQQKCKWLAHVVHNQSSSELSYAKPSRVFTAFSGYPVSVPADLTENASFPDFCTELEGDDDSCSLLGFDEDTLFTDFCSVLSEDGTWEGVDVPDWRSLWLLALCRFGLISTMFFKRSCCLHFPSASW